MMRRAVCHKRDPFALKVLSAQTDKAEQGDDDDNSANDVDDLVQKIFPSWFATRQAL